MTSSAQLEREAEATRGQVAGTLNELRERITPGQLMDQAADYAKASGGGDFVRNLGRQMADNPLPVCLIGAGMAWLMLANGSRSGGLIDQLRLVLDEDAQDASGEARRLRWLSVGSLIAGIVCAAAIVTTTRAAIDGLSDALGLS